MRTVIVLIGLGLLAGCAGIEPPSTDDVCRGSSHCSPSCGTMSSGASGDCDPHEQGGRTRG